MSYLKSTILSAGVLLTASVYSSASHAVFFDCTTNPGICTAEGDTVIFSYAGTSDVMGLFGQLQVIGDSIFASPTDFRAHSKDGSPTGVNGDTADANGSIQVTAKTGYKIDAVDIIEIGDYMMTAGDTNVSVTGMAGYWEWDSGLSTFTGSSLNVTGLDGIRDKVFEGEYDANDGIRDGNTHIWQASWSASSIGLLDMGLQLQNNLSATTLNAGEEAWVEKKLSEVKVGITTTVIPVPAAVWLFGSGLLGLVGIARRTKK